MSNTNFEERRAHLANLSDEELKNKFWSLLEQVVDPLVDLAKKNTTPSIERSVLLRMGFSSVESAAIVNGAMDRGLMPYGCGHIVYRLSKDKNIEIRDAGLKLINGELWDEAIKIFKGGSI